MFVQCCYFIYCIHYTVKMMIIFFLWNPKRIFCKSLNNYILCTFKNNSRRREVRVECERKVGECWKLILNILQT